MSHVDIPAVVSSDPSRLASLWGAILLATAVLVQSLGGQPYIDATAAHLPARIDTSYRVAAADVDDDGDLDLLVAAAGQCRLLLNDGHGTFADGTATSLPPGGDTILAAAFADVDADGDPDLFLASFHGRDRLLINSGTGAFLDVSAARLPATALQTVALAVGDLDGDGDPDLVSVVRGGANRVFINTAGNFSDETRARLPADSERHTTAALFDADGDDDLDLFIGVERGQSRLYSNNGVGVFSDTTATALPQIARSTLHAASADLDGDGDLDLILAEGPDGARLLSNHGTGGFIDESPGRLPALVAFPIQAIPVDADVDDDTDLLLVGPGQNRLLLNDGAGQFTDATPTGLPADEERTYGATAADLDGDLDPDLILARPQAQNRLWLNALAAPRARLTVVPAVVEVGSPVNIALQTFAENGIAATTLLVNGAPLALVGGTAQYTPVTAGPYVVQASARDALGHDSAVHTAHFSAVANLVPVVNAGPNGNVFRGQTFSSAGAFADPGAGPWTATVDYGDGSGEQPLALAGDKTFGLNHGYDQFGTFAVTVRVNDGQATGLDTAQVTVRSRPPLVAAIPGQVAQAPMPFAAIRLDDYVADPDHADAEIAWQVTGSTVLQVNIDAERVAHLSYPADARVTETLTFTATDPLGEAGASSASFTVAETISDYLRPVVTVTATPVSAAPGATVTLTVAATDDSPIVYQRLVVGGVPVTLAPNGTAGYTSALPGVFLAEATAMDAAGNQGYATTQIRFLTPGDTTPPVAEITTPTSLSEVSEQVQIVGTATDANFMRYTLAHAASGDSNSIPFASGTTPVSAGVLGTLDTSRLRNGSYDVRLTVEDTSGNLSSSVRRILAVGPLKPGLARLRFVDLNIAGVGVDLCIIRSYDSQNKRKGDFGIGWAMGLNDFHIHESAPLGTGWSMSVTGGAFTIYRLNEDEPHYVVVRYPDDSVETFRLNATPLSNLWGTSWDVTVSFLAEAASRSTLAAVGDNLVTVTPGPGQVQLEKWGFAGLYDPQRYRLTTRHGYTYVIHKATGVESVRDPRGNTLTIGPTGVTHSCGRSVQFTRDAQGRITTITDPLGNTLGYEYDAYGDLVAYTDPLGRVTRFIYDSQHNLLDLIGPTGQRDLQQQYDAAGRLVAITSPEAGRSELDHDPAARTETIRDALGRVTRYAYDALGNVTSVTDPLGNTATFTYDADGRLTQETDPMGHAWIYGRDANGRATTLTTPDGGTFALGYDGNGQISAVTNPLGHREEWLYDRDGQLTAVKDPLGNTRSWTYDADGHLTAVTDALGNVTRYQYNSHGDRTQVVFPGGHELNLTYNANGDLTGTTTERTLANGTKSTVTTGIEYDGLKRPTARTRPGNRRYQYRYADSGRLQSIITPEGTPISSVRRGAPDEIISERPGVGNRVTRYTPTGVPSRTTDRVGRTTQYTYDLRDSLTRLTRPSGETVQMAYDDAGRTRQITYPSGLAVALDHNATGQLTGVALPDGRRSDFVYDGAFHLASATDAAGRTTRNQRDAAGRVTRLELPDGATWDVDYDANGRAVAATAPNGSTIAYAYDVRGRLVSVTDALGGTTTYGYDEVGNLISITDAAGQLTLCEYNDAGQMTRRTLDLGMSESWSYDERGRPATHTDFAGRVVTYAYHAVGGLAEMRCSDGSVTALTVLASGLVSSSTDAAGTATFEYDNADRLVRETNPDGQAVTYTYDGGGRLATLESVAGRVAYTYDAEGRMTTVTDPDGGLTQYTYNAVGKLAGVSLPNGVIGGFTYDLRDHPLLVEYRAPGGAVLASYAYTYDEGGRVTRVLEADGRQVHYTYDALDRLTAEQVTDPGMPPRLVSYTYDEVGNRLTRTDAGSTTSYTYDTNHRLTRAGDASFTYDANGNLTGMDDGHGRILTYLYNGWGQLTGVTESTGPTTRRVDMTYSSGQRLGLAVDETDVRRYVVSTNGPYPRVLAELDGAGNLTAGYVYGHGPIRRHGGTDRYYVQDAGESVRCLTDTAGTVTDTYTYDAFGRLSARQGTSANPFLYTGDELDPVSALYYLRARYYDPNTGRFLAHDPGGTSPTRPATYHPYLYAENSPVSRVDHTGAIWDMSSMMTAVSVLSILTTANAILISSDWHPFSSRAVYDGINDDSGIENLQRPLDQPSFGGSWLQMGSSYSWDLLTARGAGSIVVSRALPWELKVATKHRTVDAAVLTSGNYFTGMMAVRDPVTLFARAFTEAGAPSDYSEETAATVEDVMDSVVNAYPFLRLRKPTAGFSVGMGLMTTRDAYSSSTLDGLSVGFTGGMSSSAGLVSMGLSLGAALGVNAGPSFTAGDVYNGAWTIGVNLSGGASIGGSFSYSDGNAGVSGPDLEWGNSWSVSFTASYALREWRFLPKTSNP